MWELERLKKKNLLCRSGNTLNEHKGSEMELLGKVCICWCRWFLLPRIVSTSCIEQITTNNSTLKIREINSHHKYNTATFFF